MRLPPHDIEAEQAVIGSLLIDPEAIAAIRERLEPEDFYVERHGHIFRAAASLADRGDPVDTLTLRSQLESSGSLQRAGGIDYIAEMSLVVPTSASVRHYADIVATHALRRRLIHAGAQVASLGFDLALTPEAALDGAERAVFGISDARRDLEASHVAPILKDTWQLLESRSREHQLVSGVATNFSKLDQVTFGLQPGELVVLAARPSVGKTSFALNIARNAAVLAGAAVAVFSLEMSKHSLVQRLICSEANVDSYLLRTNQLDTTAYQRIAKAMDTLTQAELWIDDTPAISIASMRARARRMKARNGIKLLVIDYLQLMRGGRQESRVQEVSDISSGLKSIAKELEIPVLALSQLSRESERRENRRPQLSDLRDSGCLAADTAVFLPDEGRSRPIASLVGRRDFPVLALDERTGRVERRLARHAFVSGHRRLLRMSTGSGGSIRATGNHRFLTPSGWRRLDEMVPGEHVALHRQAAGAPSGPAGWERVGSVVVDGRDTVYDLTVDELHNFVANDVVVHNSIEQDADVVLFLYRPGMHKEDIDRSVTELIVAKNRNGPTLDIELVFNAAQTAFREPVPYLQER